MVTLPENVSALSDQQKFELLDAIWSDLETNAGTLSDEQAAELDARVEAYAKDRTVAASWDRVKAEQPHL